MGASNTFGGDARLGAIDLMIPKNVPSRQDLDGRDASRERYREPTGQNITVSGRRQVLVVDDDATARTLVRLNLEFEGYTVSEAENGDRGLESARSSRPDLILLDVMMPGTEGLQVLAELRDDPLLRSTPVIMLTGRADEGTEWRARDLGAAAYVAKPVAVDDLLRTIACVLATTTPQSQDPGVD